MSSVRPIVVKELKASADPSNKEMRKSPRTQSSRLSSRRTGIAEGGDPDDEWQQPTFMHPTLEAEIFLRQQRERLFKLPPNTTPRPWLSYFFFPIASLCFEKRLDQLFLLSGREAKAGLISEMSTHILIDCLFLTITAQPIYNNGLEMSSTVNKVTTCLFYFTFHCELISILAHGVFIFSLVEKMSVLVPEWGMRRKSAILFIARIHIFGLMLFFLCSIMWPIAVFSESSGINSAYLPVLVVSLAPWLFVVAHIGTMSHAGVLDSLYPMIKLDFDPASQVLRDMVERDIAAYREAILIEESDAAAAEEEQAKQSIDLATFLDSLHLSHLEEVFVAEKVTTVAALMHLDNDDYRQLGVTLRDRTRLQCALCT